MIVILNDNQMSIAPNVGAVSQYLTRLRTSKGWLSAKKAVGDFLLRIPGAGKKLHALLQRFKNHIRNVFVKDDLFQAFGFRYLGPVDGHDEPGLERYLRRAQGFDGPVLLHIVTQKGKGYAFSERSPANTHGVSAVDPESGSPRASSSARSFGGEAGALLTRLAESDPRIVAITAAMADSTGLRPFQQRYPDRLFDVGIAEEHAVVMAAGMACRGLRPVVAVYDTFLQRAYDQLVVDVCLQNLPVCFIIDRAALGGGRPSHHGVFGTAYMRHIPNMTLLVPRCVDEMLLMLRFALRHDGPVAIRYPRAERPGQPAYRETAYQPGRWERIGEGGDLVLIAMGPMVVEALTARDILLKGGVRAQVVNAGSVKPLDEAFLNQIGAKGVPYVVLEEQALMGGLGSAIAEYAVQQGLPAPARLFALPDRFIPHGKHDELIRSLGLDGQSIAAALQAMLRRIA